MFAKNFILNCNNSFAYKNSTFELSEKEYHPLLTFMQDVHSLKMSQIFTTKNKYLSSKFYQSVVLLFRIFCKFSIDLSSENTDDQDEILNIQNFISEFLMDKDLNKILREEMQDLDKYVHDNFQNENYFSVENPSSSIQNENKHFNNLNKFWINQSDVLSENETVLLFVYHIINNIYLKENFTGPGYLNFRSSNEFKKTYQINHFHKYRIEFDESLLEIFSVISNSIESQKNNQIEFSNNFEMNPGQSNTELFYSSNICEWTFNLFKLKSFIKHSSKKYDNWFIINGEDFQRPTKLLHILKIIGIISSHLYTINCDTNSLNKFFYQLIMTRFFNVQSQLNEFPTEFFKKKLNEGYSSLLDLSKSEKSKLNL